MFNFFKKKKTDKELLREQVVTTVATRAAVKNPFYHEIIGELDRFTLRIYNRKTSELVVNNVYETQDEAIKQALDLLVKMNKGEQQ